MLHLRSSLISGFPSRCCDTATTIAYIGVIEVRVYLLMYIVAEVRLGRGLQALAFQVSNLSVSQI